MSSESAWHFSGEIAKFGVNRPEKAKWGRLWILVKLDNMQYAYQGKTVDIQKNSILLTVDLSFADDRKAKVSKKVVELLESGNAPYLFVRNAFLAQIKKNKKDENGNWTEHKETGVKANVFNISLSQYSYPRLNQATIIGKVDRQSAQKIIIEDSYRNPSDGKTYTRPIPLVLPDNMADNIKDKYVFVNASLCGRTPEDEIKTHGIVNQIIVI